jgi:putative lipoprotein
MTRRSAAALVAFAAAALGRAGASRADDADPWFGSDKALHFAATSSLAVVGYAGTAMLTTDRSTRAGAGEALGVGVGIAKELWDLDGHGDASWRDLTWDLVGATTGVLVALAVDWTIHRIFDWPVGTQLR